MKKYTYTFNGISKEPIEISACNLVTACETLLGNVGSNLHNFIIERRGTQYLQSTPFNERTHIVRFNPNNISEVSQRKKP